ncbi:MAG: hypothetical protein K0M70_08265 [Arenimonas sp.]|uniref:hypothetical protein n=1 Tax=Arenimonas sp. TaxID=1872635 RepID=UPI0025B9AD39|nr:hypothetical protein [Arenimonas sp.]MBW8367836.1 hypothetical protein [Arenimonas sp.]
MPMYMDIHNVDGATADAIASAHDAGDYDSGVRGVLFTDIVGSTELNQRLGDATLKGFPDPVRIRRVRLD